PQVLRSTPPPADVLIPAPGASLPPPSPTPEVQPFPGASLNNGNPITRIPIMRPMWGVGFDDKDMPPMSAIEKAYVKLEHVFDQDKVRNVAPGVILKVGDKKFAVTSSTATIAPKNVNASLDRVSLVVDQLKAAIPLRNIQGANDDVIAYLVEFPLDSKSLEKLNSISLDNIAKVEVGDTIAVLDPEHNVGSAGPLPITNGGSDVTENSGPAMWKSFRQDNTAEVVKLNREYIASEGDFKHRYEGLIEVKGSVLEGTAFHKDGKLVGIVVAGMRFVGKHSNTSYLVPAERIVEFCKKIADKHPYNFSQLSETEGGHTYRMNGPLWRWIFKAQPLTPVGKAPSGSTVLLPQLSDVESAVVKVFTEWSAVIQPFFSVDRAFQACQGLAVKIGDRSAVLVIGLTILGPPDRRDAGVERFYVEIDGKPPMPLGTDSRSDLSLASYPVEKELPSVVLSEMNTAAVAVGDVVTVVQGEQFYDAPPGKVIALNRSHLVKEGEMEIKFDGLIEVEGRFREGTPLFKEGKLVGMVLAGERFVPQKENRSYLVPAKKILEYCRGLEKDDKARAGAAAGITPNVRPFPGTPSGADVLAPTVTKEPPDISGIWKRWDSADDTFELRKDETTADNQRIVRYVGVPTSPDVPAGISLQWSSEKGHYVGKYWNAKGKNVAGEFAVNRVNENEIRGTVTRRSDKNSPPTVSSLRWVRAEKQEVLTPAPGGALPLAPGPQDEYHRPAPAPNVRPFSGTPPGADVFVPVTPATTAPPDAPLATVNSMLAEAAYPISDLPIWNKAGKSQDVSMLLEYLRPTVLRVAKQPEVRCDYDTARRTLILQGPAELHKAVVEELANLRKLIAERPPAPTVPDLRIYKIDDLPIWSKYGKTTNGFLMLYFLRANVAPERWESGEIKAHYYEQKKSLIVLAPEAIQDQIAAKIAEYRKRLETGTTDSTKAAPVLTDRIEHWILSNESPRVRRASTTKEVKSGTTGAATKGGDAAAKEGKHIPDVIHSGDIIEIEITSERAKEIKVQTVVGPAVDIGYFDPVKVIGLTTNDARKKILQAVRESKTLVNPLVKVIMIRRNPDTLIEVRWHEVSGDTVSVNYGVVRMVDKLTIKDVLAGHKNIKDWSKKQVNIHRRTPDGGGKKVLSVKMANILKGDNTTNHELQAKDCITVSPLDEAQTSGEQEKGSPALAKPD
ncbi:MAG: hypothetical protein SGJ20_22430, partial [Planctomycetota bacterium]|nr:hypothetical protein [Planctomycetota bacterium]